VALRRVYGIWSGASSVQALYSPARDAVLFLQGIFRIEWFESLIKIDKAHH
jgi:hypothetical protein